MKSTGMQMIGFQKSRSNRECHVDIFLKFPQNHVMCSPFNHNFLSPVSSHFRFPNFIRNAKLLQKNVHQSQCLHLSMNEMFHLKFMDVSNQILSFDWVLLLQVLYI